MTKKRRYGDAWKDISIDERQLDPVFDRFFGENAPKPTAPPAEGAPPVEAPAPEAPTPKTAAPRRMREPLLEGAAPAEGAPPVKGWAAIPVAPPRKGAAPAEERVLIASPHSRLAHEVIDELWPTLDQPMQSVYAVLYRLSYGFGRRYCKIGLKRLAERCNLSLNPTRAAARRLELRGLIRNVAVDNEAGNYKERGIQWEVFLPEGVQTTDVAPTRGADAGKGAPPAKGAAPREVAAPDAGAMKSSEKENEIRSSIYEIRMIAARIRERNHGRLGYDTARFRDDVRTALVGQNREVDEDLIEEAIKGMAL